MRILASVTLIALASLATAGNSYAGCKNTNWLPGSIGPNATDQRSFTITRPGGVVLVQPSKSKDMLSLKVDRPSGAEACKERGPSNPVVCFPTVKNKTGEGMHTVYVINTHSRTVNYKIRCKN